MLTRKYINLILALILAASTFGLLLGTCGFGGRNAEASASALKSKILRKKNRLNSKLDPAEVALLRSHAQEKEERKFEDEIPKHVPIKIKLKPEKEKKFKDLDNPNWHRDFELEVTNTSDKPIYYLELWLEYPEIESGIGAPVVVPLRFGRMNFIDHHTVPLATDVPIQPGETFAFVIPESDRKGWEWNKKNRQLADPKKIVLKFVTLSFGNGTGFDTLDAKPYPRHKEQSLGPALVRVPSLFERPQMSLCLELPK